MAILSFRRIEKKYIVTEEQKQQLIEVLKEHMELDPFCKMNRLIGYKIFTMTHQQMNSFLYQLGNQDTNKN